MQKKYRMGFDVWALILFIAVMIPNFVWSAIPAPNDILRVESVTQEIDNFAMGAQVVMILSLCVFINTERKKQSFSPLIIISAVCVLMYFACWVLYYMGIVAVTVIIGMTVLPCLAFLLFAIERKNVIALIPTIIFTVCHIVFALFNFVI